MEVQIRLIGTADAEAVAGLSGELGYPASAAAMEERIRNYARLTDRVVFVACQDGAVIGWIDVGIVHHLQVEPNGEIGGLVVSHTCRNLGLGAKLIARAEQWVKERGLTRMIVRSQIAREAAHRFYLREGYERTKTSAVFSKTLAVSSKTPAASQS
jgi:GNAT superfamily N-acetyltransferase